ncbi:acetyl-CoA carboxylase carboxyltransferase subunit alpha [bacterium]|nr:acetyl-CoA carboxylase carboxyltransferase subunit alpha [bacterium]
MQEFLSFEQGFLEIEREIEKASNPNSLKALKRKLSLERKRVSENLSSYQKVLLARHPKRPHFSDYIEGLFSNFIELSGDRLFADDRAIIGGCGIIGGQRVMVIGQEKGKDTKEKIKRNFGMAHPEGYRKARRLMELSNRFGIPILTFIDTSGAYPGIGAEERGQSIAIAEAICTSFNLAVPIISTILGEGGSGGALAIGICDRLLMLEYSIYSVASPEACAAILWRDQSKTEEASANLHLTGEDLHKLGIADQIIKEPMGGAHWEPDKMVRDLKSVLLSNLKELMGMDRAQLLVERKKRFRKIGIFEKS